MTEPVFDFQAGTLPLLVSIPHLGRIIPDALASQYTDVAHTVADTDWHLDRLYDFAMRAGASVLSARVSRYVIDLNRPPSGESLYPGRTDASGAATSRASTAGRSRVSMPFSSRCASPRI